MMSVFSNVIDAAREYLRIPSIEADVKALNESAVAVDINIAKVQATAHNEQLKLGCMLHELRNSISISSAKLENERRRREDAEKQLTVAIALLTNKINRIESIVDQCGESAGSHQEK